MVNNVVLVGRITRDIELRATTSNTEVVSFSLAVNRNFKNAQGEYDADFINCVAFGQQARFMNNYLSKGRLIAVVGEIRTRNYENQNGQRVYVTEVLANQVTPLESRSQTNNDNSYDASYVNPNMNNMDNAYNQVQPQAPTQPTMPQQQNQTESTPYDFMNFDEIDENDLPF